MNELINGGDLTLLRNDTFCQEVHFKLKTGLIDYTITKAKQYHKK